MHWGNTEGLLIEGKGLLRCARAQFFKNGKRVRGSIATVGQDSKEMRWMLVIEQSRDLFDWVAEQGEDNEASSGDGPVAYQHAVPSATGGTGTILKV